MFTFALAFLAGHGYFSLIFNLFLPRGKRKKEFGRKHSQQKPLTTTLSGIDRFVCFAAYFPSFPKENTFQSLENFRTINRKTEFPDFSLTDFPWLFPDLEKLPFFSYFSLIVATLIAVKRAEPTRIKLCRVPPTPLGLRSAFPARSWPTLMDL